MMSYDEFRERVPREGLKRDRFLAIGVVRGWCGHQHKTEEACHKCITRDRDGCMAQGGYSDRYTYRSNNLLALFWEVEDK